MNSKDFVSGQPFVVDADDDLERPWGGRGLQCGWCAHRFRVGEVARWQHGHAAPNLFVCAEHDTADLVDRWTARYKHAVAESIVFGLRP